MTASASALAKVCNMMKSDMDTFLQSNDFTTTTRKFFDKETGDTIVYTAYDTHEVVKAIHKHHKKKLEDLAKQEKKANKKASKPLR